MSGTHPTDDATPTGVSHAPRDARTSQLRVGGSYAGTSALAFVNGCPVPAYVPRDHVALYFPRGILGLTAEARTPETLDASLKISATQGGGGLAGEGGRRVRWPVFPSPRGGLHFLPTVTYVHAFLPSSRGKDERRLTRGGRRASVLSGGSAAAESAADDDDEDIHGAAAASPSSPPEESPAAEGANPRPNARREGPASDGRTHRDGAQPAFIGTLVRMGFLQQSGAVEAAAVANGAAGGNGSDLTARWQRRRRRELLWFLGGMAATLGLAIVAGPLDMWYVCECANSGVWQSCSSCTVSSGKTNTTTIGSNVKPVCIEQVSIGECDGPNYSSLQALIIAAIVSTVLHAIAGSVDAIFAAALRRPFFLLLYVVALTLHLAMWASYARAGTVAVKAAATQVDCSMETAFWFHFQGVAPTVFNRDTIQFAKSCRFGPSFYLWIASWGIYLLFGLNYFTRRYLAWRSWTSTGNIAGGDASPERAVDPPDDDVILVAPGTVDVGDGWIAVLPPGDGAASNEPAEGDIPRVTVETSVPQDAAAGQSGGMGRRTPVEQKGHREGEQSSSDHPGIGRGAVRLSPALAEAATSSAQVLRAVAQHLSAATGALPDPPEVTAAAPRTRERGIRRRQQHCRSLTGELEPPCELIVRGPSSTLPPPAVPCAALPIPLNNPP